MPLLIWKPKCPFQRSQHVCKHKAMLKALSLAFVHERCRELPIAHNPVEVHLMDLPNSMALSAQWDFGQLKCNIFGPKIISVNRGADGSELSVPDIITIIAEMLSPFVFVYPGANANLASGDIIRALWDFAKMDCTLLGL